MGLIAETLKQAGRSYRDQVISNLFNMCERVKDAYLLENSETVESVDDFALIELPDQILLSVDEFDANICEYIIKISIDGKTVIIDGINDERAESITVLENAVLVAIVEQLEELLQDTTQIDIY